VSKNRTKKERKSICNDWQRSGLTKTEFCLRNNLNFRSFGRWSKNTKKSIPKKDAIPGTKSIKFFPVDSSISNNIKRDCNNHECKNFLEISLLSGISFRAYLSESSINVFLRDLLK